MKKRASGILLHISSLPGNYGIGDLGQGSYDFVDFLEKAGQKFWQILPLGITGYGDSPYQSFSAFAGNPYFIDMDMLIKEGYLTKIEVENLELGNDRKIDYHKLYINKMYLLRKAYYTAKNYIMEDLNKFYKEDNIWLRDFSLFMALKDYNQGKSWTRWPQIYKEYNSRDVLEFEKNNKDSIYFWVFTQYYFFQQWNKLREYANKKGISILGDIPIYVAEDSCDVWANVSLFNLDEDLLPLSIAGSPPDYFSKEGQLWGNPIYNWDYMEKNDFQWWVRRIEHGFKLHDSLRIDHFRGFDAYWEVEYGSENAIDGKWRKGPSMKLFNKLKEELGALDIIAEDLGHYTESLGELLIESGYPGMKVLQFAFNPGEDNKYLPHNCERNSIIYTGTHDNPTATSWFEGLEKEELDFVVEYLRLDKEEGYNWGLIRGAWSSPSFLAVAQMQDFLNLGSEARMNTPSTLGNNWTWRMTAKDIDDQLASRIRKLTLTYRR